MAVPRKKVITTNRYKNSLKLKDHERIALCEHDFLPQSQPLYVEKGVKVCVFCLKKHKLSK